MARFAIIFRADANHIDYHRSQSTNIERAMMPDTHEFPVTLKPIGSRLFVDGVTRDVFLDDDGRQFVLDFALDDPAAPPVELHRITRGMPSTEVRDMDGEAPVGSAAGLPVGSGAVFLNTTVLRWPPTLAPTTSSF